MRYWCESYAYSNGYNYGYTFCSDDGYRLRYHRGMGFRYSNRSYDIRVGYSPSMLVTGVKLEEVVLNAILV